MLFMDKEIYLEVLDAKIATGRQIPSWQQWTKIIIKLLAYTMK